MHHYTAQAIQQTLAPSTCITAMREAFLLTHQGQIHQPPRQITPLPQQAGMAFMPGALEPSGGIGAKVVVRLAPESPGGRHRKSGVFLLFSPHTAELLATFDAHALTLLRTAASTVVATQALANPGAKTIGLIGTGDLAHAHLQAFATQPNTARILIWGRHREAAEALARQAPANIPTETCTDLDSLLAQADVVCTLTSASQPILSGHSLHPGQHLNLVGSSTAQDLEVEPSVVTRGPVWLDDIAAARANAAELRLAVEQGHRQWEDFPHTIGGVLAGDHPGRKDQSQITVFKSLGLFAEDILAAQTILNTH